MKHLSRFMFIVVIAAMFPAARSVAQDIGLFPPPLETLPGFKANGVYETQGIENLSLFNGDPQLAVPLGPGYPLGFGASFRLTAHYSSRFWYMWQAQWGWDDYGGPLLGWRAHVRGLPTLGVGWTLELGSIDPAPPDTYERPRYLSPDGGIHEFVEPVLGALQGPIQDGDFRIQRAPGSGYVVRFPDGTSHWMMHFYHRPDPRTGWGNGTDFSDVGRDQPARTARWGLSEIRDRNGVTVVTVKRDTTEPWKVVSIWLPNDSRKIDLHWTDLELSDDAGKVFHWDVVSSIDFPVLSGASEPSTVLMSYSPTGHFSRSSVESGTPGWVALGPPQIYLPLLTSITQGTEIHEFGYSLGNTGTGLLTSFRLPTGSLVEYGYWPSTAGPPCLFGIGCETLDEGTSTAPEVVAVDPSDRVLAVQAYLDRSAAVISRTERDPTNGNAAATTTYVRAQFAQRLEGTPPDVLLRDPARILRRVIVKRPSGNGDTQATRHVFHVLTDEIPGGTIWVDAVTLGPGIEVERRTYSGATASGTPVRSVALCYDQVSVPLDPTYCGALADEDTIAEFPIGSPGWRASREVTWYGANPPGGGECSDATATQVACQYVSRSGWKPEALEFEQETVGAPTVGPSAVLMQAGQTGRTTSTDWAPFVLASLNPALSRWLPKLYTTRTVTDLFPGGCTFPPCSVTTTADFDQSTGRLNSSTVSGTDASRTVAYSYTDGDPTTETISGTQLSGTFVTSRSFLNGQVTSSQRTGIGWLQYDVTRDSALGLVTESRDPNGLETTYTWDSLARLRGIDPPGTQEHPTTICYGPWTPASGQNPAKGAWALVRKGTTTSCGTTAALPAAESETVEAYVYDGWGRLSREIRLLPNTLTPTGSNYLAVRTTQRNAIGLVIAVSEWEPCGTGTNFATCFSASATKKTGFSNFDVFGRPRTITLPDSTVITKVYDDWHGQIQIPSTDTREDTYTSNVAGGQIFEAVRKDLFGRPVIAAEPTRVTEPPTDAPLTFYRHDIHDQVAQVKQSRTISPAVSYEQERLFARNALGFLTSETQPESGTTAYSGFTALGQPMTKTISDGGSTLTLTSTYDALGRLLTTSFGPTASKTLLVENNYDELEDPDDNPLGSSKGRLTTSIGWNTHPSVKFDDLFYPRGSITDYFTYDGPGGRLSKKRTMLSNGTVSATASWSYNDLGLVENEAHPRVDPGHSPALVVKTTYTAGFPTKLAVGAQSIVSSVKYDPAGGLASYTSGNGVRTDILADETGMPRPRRIATSTTSTITGDLFDTGDYSYDGAGNITQMRKAVDGVEIFKDEFEYDAASRLVQAKFGNHSQDYAYDGWGNLTSKAGATIGVNKETNRLSGAGYDFRGNVTTLGSESYKYDALGRQVRHDAPSSHLSYLFDGAGERLVKASPPPPHGSGVNVLRREMARIVAQILDMTPLLPDSATFADVPNTDPDRGWIERLYGTGIVAGCQTGPPMLYCPDVPVKRDEMAVFLGSAMTYETGSIPLSGWIDGQWFNCDPGAAGVSIFGDVPASHWACRFIHFLYASRVTAGCGTSALNYCPGAPVDHWEMQVFASVIKEGFGYVPPGSTYSFRSPSGAVLTEFRDTPALRAGGYVANDYVYLGNRLVGTKDAAGWKYHVTDHLGSVRLTMGASGNESRKYWPWGEENGTPGSSVMGFAGMERDLEVTEATRPRYYVHARNLETGYGRFLSPDMLSGTVADPQSWNRYTYARNNPLRYVDPDGNAPAVATIIGMHFGMNTGGAQALASMSTAGPIVAGGAVGGSILVGAAAAPALATVASSVSLSAAVAFPRTTALLIELGASYVGANYAQRAFRPNFSDRGAQELSKATGLAIRSIDDLSAALRSGAASPSQVEVNVVVRDGQALVLNTRSVIALQRAGVPTSEWKIVPRTGEKLYEKLLTEQLRRNRLTSAGTTTVTEAK